ncbi:MAG: hypothetical protein PUC88_04755 [Clostridia bacterium]|nr:hypothetical protein [Clostridia bacterium]
MYCGKCGTLVESDIMYCPNCGNKIIDINQSTQKQQSIKKKRLPRLLGIVVGAVVFVVLICFFINGSGYRKTLNNYCKAYENNDVDLMHSSVVAQYWTKYMGSGSHRDVEDIMKNNVRKWGCGEITKISYTINSEKRATKEELEALEDNIYVWLAHCVYDEDEFNISDAYVLDVDLIIYGTEGMNSIYFPNGLLLIKENGEWRIPFGPIKCSFYSNQ